MEGSCLDCAAGRDDDLHPVVGERDFVIDRRARRRIERGNAGWRVRRLARGTRRIRIDVQFGPEGLTGRLGGEGEIHAGVEPVRNSLNIAYLAQQTVLDQIAVNGRGA